MQISDWVGSLAATLTTVSFIPQALHTYRSKDVGGISLLGYSSFTVGVGMWLIYGLLLREGPIVIANAITVSFASLILLMKIRYR